jgi:dTDP-glucose 4,6-dehydratase
MLIYVDIDNTIALTIGTNYKKAIPVKDRIKKINNLYESGHKIIYWTARGSQTGIDWKAVTTFQLLRWGAKFHELKMGKPAYDLFIDDKNINSEMFFNHTYLGISTQNRAEPRRAEDWLY